MSELAVVIPVLDEAACLPRLLRALRAQQGVDLEILVADGGSTDCSAGIAREHGARVVPGARGRGAQMNAAARASRAPLLLFLHADSGLPDPGFLGEAVRAFREAAAGGPRVAGHFALRFEREQAGHDLFFRYVEGKTRLNRPYTINGDQGLLISRGYFEELGGFDERLPFLEDQRIADRIFRTGQWILLPGTLTTSARRFEREGHAERYTLMALIMGLHAAGAGEFFTRQGVYAAQGDTARLDLRPHLRQVRCLLREAGWRRAAGIVLDAGAFIRENAWQPFYYRDLRRDDGRGASLAWFDRRLAPHLRHRVIDAGIGLAAVAWFLGALPVVLAVRDFRSQ